MGGESGADVSVLEVGVPRCGLWVVCPQLARPPRVPGARASPHAGQLLRLVLRAGGIEPKHSGGCVVPEGKHEDNAPAEGFAHLLQAALRTEVVGVVKGIFLSLAEVLGDGTPLHSFGRRIGVVDDLAVLQVDAPDFGEIARVGAVVRKELGDDGEGPRRVDDAAGAEEVVLAHAEGVEVAPVLVAHTSVAVALQRVPAIGALALHLTLNGTGVWRVRL
mmetsp:Transcript_15489/g.32669  ORF Transcript_15489/g.32669 Transcript_15489/m.32669 type:complete len:219 (+) Transcript_15489:1194-1850(+)